MVSLDEAVKYLIMLVVLALRAGYAVPPSVCDVLRGVVVKILGNDGSHDLFLRQSFHRQARDGRGSRKADV